MASDNPSQRCGMDQVLGLSVRHSLLPSLTQRGALTLAMLVAILLLAACGERTVRVLFFGNSLTYVGNLPAVFSALCTSSGHRCATEMIAQGGATLTQRVEDNSLARSTKPERFDYIVLQERGGDYITVPGRLQITTQAERATETLARDAIQMDIKPILLGTYQGNAHVSADLVSVEAALAARLGMRHVPVSEVLACARREQSSLRWLHQDGMHPGPDLTLLMAVLLHEELFGSYPPPSPIVVSAPMYGPTNGPRADSFASTQSTLSSIERSVTYSAETVRSIVALAQGPCK